MKALNYLFLASIFFCFLFIASCDNPNAFNEKMRRISEGKRKLDSTAQKVSKGLSKFAEHVEKYVDTTQYRKDTTDKWVKK